MSEENSTRQMKNEKPWIICAVLGVNGKSLRLVDETLGHSGRVMSKLFQKSQEVSEVQTPQTVKQNFEHTFSHS